MTPLRTYVYIDGFNLFYGQLKGKPVKWLDLVALMKAYLDPAKNDLIKIKYFTALVKPRPHDPNQTVRQQMYLRALATFPEIEVVHGHFLTHPVKMPLADGSGYAEVMKTEEKKSDVNIAVHMLHDAYRDLYDLAVLVSNDSDLSEPLRIIAQEMNKKIGILNPHERPSKELQQYANFKKRIRSSVVANCQLPQTLTDTKGTFHKPVDWQ